jgi:hypothetical protein
MRARAVLKFYVWSGSRRLVLHAAHALEAARQLVRRAMDAGAFDELDDVVCVSLMGFDGSLFRFDVGQVVISMTFPG